ncbi:MAG: DUF7220 family protein [Nitrosotalea sp.]
MTLDTRKKNLSEAFVNSFGAYPIGYGISLIILPFFAPMIQKDPFTVNLLITTIYATISFTRIYFLRRLFQKLGCDDNFIRFLPKLFKQIRRKTTFNHQRICQK